MFFLFDFEHGTVLECPADNVRLGRGPLHPLTAGQLGPKIGKLVELDEVPDLAKLGLDDGRFGDRGRRRDAI